MKNRITASIAFLLLICAVILLSTCEDPAVSPAADVPQSPAFSIDEGTCKKDIEVSISCPAAGAEIYYTPDGTEPDTGSLVYSDPVSVAGDGNNISIKAAAEGDGDYGSNSGSACIF